ncbi:MAG: hypothetical protein IKV43_06375, partial [Clostridia bacterium]|nr:hypothetical protein [Clostridia bacterium]
MNDNPGAVARTQVCPANFCDTKSQRDLAAAVVGVDVLGDPFLSKTGSEAVKFATVGEGLAPPAKPPLCKG